MTVFKAKSLKCVCCRRARPESIKCEVAMSVTMCVACVVCGMYGVRHVWCAACVVCGIVWCAACVVCGMCGCAVRGCGHCAVHGCAACVHCAVCSVQRALCIVVSTFIAARVHAEVARHYAHVPVCVFPVASNLTTAHPTPSGVPEVSPGPPPAAACSLRRPAARSRLLPPGARGCRRTARPAAAACPSNMASRSASVNL